MSRALARKGAAAVQERFKWEQEFVAKERIKEKDARKAAYLKEQERIAKADAARSETEKIIEQQQRLVEARKREMARRDAERALVKAEKHKIVVRAARFAAAGVSRATGAVTARRTLRQQRVCARHLVQ